MSSLEKRRTQLKNDFLRLTNWEDKYKKIIELGRALPPMDPQFVTDDNKVKGCQSQVWLHASLNSQKEIELQGDSDALIVKGLVAVLIFVYSQSSPQDVLQNPPDFLKELGFEANLSPSRTNGLYSMIKQIKYYATAFQYLLSK